MSHDDKKSERELTALLDNYAHILHQHWNGRVSTAMIDVCRDEIRALFVRPSLAATDRYALYPDMIVAAANLEPPCGAGDFIERWRAAVKVAPPAQPSPQAATDDAERLHWLLSRLEDGELHRIVGRAADENGIFSFERIIQVIDEDLTTAMPASLTVAPPSHTAPTNGAVLEAYQKGLKDAALSATLPTGDKK